MDYLERPSYEEHDIYRALDVLAEECDFIQSEAFKNSNFLTDRNDGILSYDCTNYYFELEQEDGIKSMGKAKNTGLIPSCRWECSRTGTEYPWLSPSFRETRTSSSP